MDIERICMIFKSKKSPRIISGVMALLCARAMFFFVDDPEGPNLLIVVVTASVLYFLFWKIRFFIVEK